MHLIPFLDLISQHNVLKDELVEVFCSALSTAGFIGGPQVEAFEEEFAQFCETKYCVGVGSCTDALRFALIAAGIEPGDTVITVPNTFIATTEAITQAGATPVFVDIDEQTYNMDPEKLETYLSGVHRSPFTVHPGPFTAGRVKAIIPVHLYGQPADMDPILEIAERYNLLVVEDACQAHGAAYHSAKANNWQTAGSMGKAAAFSFYPGKNLGACGEAGALTTNDEDIAKKVRMLRDHGQASKYYHGLEGYNGRLDAIQAGILRVKLKHLSEWTEKRRLHAIYYTDLLNQVDGIIAPQEASWARSVYHLYVIRTREREHLKDHLDKAGIATGLHYPLPLHMQKAYAALGYQEGDFPVSERVAKEILSLPMFPELTQDQQITVVEKIKGFLNG
ncbi:MAG: DegT/DnrJ/EryC1/StrS family aminotransferase [Deltaproteobacteria bacterium]|nr:DegT/DnrJ/EryC1/StrS family aminotransferase [Deltaproteobacteria bacterium]